MKKSLVENIVFGAVLPAVHLNLILGWNLLAAIEKVCKFKQHSYERRIQERSGKQLSMCRNSHRRCSIRKDVLRNFAKSTGKHLCQRPTKKGWHSCFPVNFAKFLRTSFFQNTSGRLLLEVVYFLKIQCFTAEPTQISWSAKLLLVKIKTAPSSCYYACYHLPKKVHKESYILDIEIKKLCKMCNKTP